MKDKDIFLLKSYKSPGWEEIKKEDKKEFREKQMERVGDKIEMYIEKEKRGREIARTRLIGYHY
ncbi:hypothetical protein ES707_03440 [subsurface metagenome]